MEELQDSDNDKTDVSVIGNHIYFYTDVNTKSSLLAIKAIKSLNDKILTNKLLFGKDPLYKIKEIKEIKENKENDEEDILDDISNDIIDDISKIDGLSPIYFHINSNGGDYFSGMAIADSIRKSRVPVYTIGEGAVASMGSIIFISGKKRFINKHAYILIHEIRSYIAGTFSNITDDFDNCKTFMKDIISYYKKYTNIKKSSLKKMLKKDIWFNSKKSLKYGIADKIL